MQNFVGKDRFVKTASFLSSRALRRRKAGPSDPLNLEKYGGRMFPWEQMLTQPRLITIHFAWLVLAIGLIVLVFLLALLRTPLPSCWEISS